jgi:hypothetical protein
MKRLGKKQLINIHNKCLNLIRSKPQTFFIFKKMKKYEGSCNWTDIEIDPRTNLISTAYHECVHYLYPDWSETQVLYAESRLINSLSVFDITCFLKHLANKLYKGELKKITLKKTKKKKKKIYKNIKK